MAAIAEEERMERENQRRLARLIRRMRMRMRMRMRRTELGAGAGYAPTVKRP
jgi:hypothetical protein